MHDYRYEKFGWKKYYQVLVIMKPSDSLGIVPTKCSGQAGTLFYYFGKGTKTGYEILKGWSSDEPCYLADSVFVEVSELENINGWNPDD